jgi:phage terminase Nu1 subunit (DNA packaging protein)
MAQDTASPTVPVGTLAKLFNLTDMRVQQLSKMGVTMRAAHGRYELWPSIKGYISYLQERAGVKAATSNAEGEDDGGDYNRHRARLYRSKADQSEIQVALIRATVHESEAVAKVWDDMIANARSKLLSMPVKLAPRLEGVMDRKEIKAVMEAAIYEALNELSTYDPVRVTRQSVPGDQPEMEAPAPADGEPMG